MTKEKEDAISLSGPLNEEIIRLWNVKIFGKKITYYIEYSFIVLFNKPVVFWLSRIPGFIYTQHIKDELNHNGSKVLRTGLSLWRRVK